MRAVSAVMLIAVVASSRAGAQQARPLPGVEVLTRGQGLPGVASPDGRWFSYWGTRGTALELYDVASQARTRVPVDIGEIACAAIGWSTDSQRVAFSHGAGVSEYNLDTRTVRRVAHTSGSHICSLAYDHFGNVSWTQASSRGGAFLHREGSAPTQLPQVAFAAFAPATGAQRLVVSRAAYGSQMRRGELATAHALDLTRPDASFRDLGLEILSNLVVDPSGKALCFRAESELVCHAFEPGERVLGERVSLGDTYPHSLHAPQFSPSGGRFLFVRDWTLFMFDFATHQERRVASLTEGDRVLFRGSTFASDEQVLLFEHNLSRTPQGPAIVRVDTRTGNHEALLRDDQQYCYLRSVGDTLFGYRTNARGGEDQTRVHIPSTRRLRRARRSRSRAHD